ncbi:hypothetical protein SPRG_09040 [Saprolegnia parasitica CBS 223.65]|uniref:HIT domain-containing protein n=1 Tax=Saprolegnia parasitica (strain CBS 223.65) TaxID=695850 RepID=A0A067CGT9_SAPPC|nr:hypothetical protein SPRG_09040 [Saprolegnia parasitica CBS 223.65]KDO25741.1 hypothetical protein SPRG_09040 [Saprolegnia parasitica CBS 223.65]|eukprot:XP_012203550.1 hypothetical protein SPRG_09040 [Saprolegnia parasitica CBS 223.65]
MAFRDCKPRAASHMLVIPKEHIVNTHALGHEHIDLGTPSRRCDVASLRGHARSRAHGRGRPGGLGKRASVLMLPELPGVFGFHQYPFTSVDHLHLHCLAPPFEPCYNRLRYRETWFANYVSVETLLASLKDGRHH